MEDRLLALVAGAPVHDTGLLAAEWQVEHTELVKTVTRLMTLEYVATTVINKSTMELTAEGRDCLEHGAPEVRLLGALPADGSGVAQDVAYAAAGLSDAKLAKVCVLLGACGGSASRMADPQTQVAFGQLMRAKAVKLDKATKMVTRTVPSLADEAQAACRALVDGGATLSPAAKKLLQRRKMALDVKTKTFSVARGAKFRAKYVEQVADLTPEMLQSGAWRDTEFKEYNFGARGAVPAGGALHPLMKVRRAFREIFLEMGFSEMPTRRWVESSFWNFDALFQPQQHPARDAHDTFFIKGDHAEAQLPVAVADGDDYVADVKKAHEQGTPGSVVRVFLVA